MDREKALAKIKKDYVNQVKTIKLAAKIANVVKPQLPKGWTVTFNFIYSGIIFMRGETSAKNDVNPDIDPREFAAVCGLVKMATGHKVSRKVWADGGRFYCLYGECNYVFDKSTTDANDYAFMSIEIRQFQLPENCTIEYTKEKKEITTAKVVGACLGMMDKENNGG